MGHRARSGATLALLLGLAACAGGEGLIQVSCGSVPPVDPDDLADTLAVTLVLAEPPTRRTDVLVRVDPLSERGAVVFSGTPPESAAAVSIALTTDAVFQGCVNERTDGFRLRAEEAPIGRAWIRVSSNRPVAVRLVTDASWADAGAASPGPAEATRDAGRGAVLVVAPGTSGRRAWPRDTPSGNHQ